MMKQIRRLAVLLLAVFLLIPQIGARAVSIDQGVITGSSVALRKEADGSSAVIMRLQTGSFVEILESNVNAEWYKVNANGTMGYINRVYVSVDPSLDAYHFACTATIEYCTTEINVRKSPSASAPILGTAPKGETYSVTKQYASPGWHAIRYQGGVGYISAQYARLNPIVSDDRLTALTVEGGTLSPSFAPGEFGYVVMASSDTVTVTASANPGVNVDVDGTGTNAVTLTMLPGSVHMVRIRLNGLIRYSVYVVRDALIIGSWNIKRGNNRLVQQGRLVSIQQPTVLALQEAFIDPSQISKIDNLLSLRTRTLKYEFFTPTISYQNGSMYGIGVLSGERILESESKGLTSLNREPRSMQKIVFSFGGKRISLYNTHYSYESNAIRIKQFAETLAILEKDLNEYKILVGDFNAKAAEFAKIKGYQVLNNTDTVFYGDDGEEFKRTTVDNIIVSNSFRVLDVRMIDTKLSDHKPLFAYLGFHDQKTE